MFFLLGLFAVPLAAGSSAQARSEMQCVLEAREVTGEYDGLEFSQAKTACLLDASVAGIAGSRAVVIYNRPEPDVLFSQSRRVASGTWVRVSPNRWMLKRQ